MNQEQFDRIVKSGKSKEAVRFLSSVAALRTEENILKVATTADLAFDILRLVPGAAKFKSLVSMASEKPRYARLIVEDLPKYHSEELFRRAINSDQDWAKKYKAEYKLSYKWLSEIIKPSKATESPKPKSRRAPERSV